MTSETSYADQEEFQKQRRTSPLHFSFNVEFSKYWCEAISYFLGQEGQK